MARRGPHTTIIPGEISKLIEVLCADIEDHLFSTRCLNFLPLGTLQSKKILNTNNILYTKNCDEAHQSKGCWLNACLDKWFNMYSALES